MLLYGMISFIVKVYAGCCVEKDMSQTGFGK